MQQYIFRGKVIGSDKWVYGNLLQRFDSLGPLSLIEVQDKETFEIETFQVYPETVGMCSTIQDQNMNYIYAGDIIKVAGRLLKVVFDAGCFLSLWGNNRYRLNQWGAEGVEIKGNIHDHPHLLNPGSGQSAINNMLDPNEKQATEEAKAAGQQIAAIESDAQEQAMESEEEGGTEG